MSTLINLAVLLALAAAAIFIIKRMRAHHKVEHVVPKDPEAQSSYEHVKHEDEEQILTLQEKVELSWEFLIKVTEQIIKKFTKKDQEVIYHAAHVFNNNGMKYHHNINQEVKIIQVQEKSKQIAQNKSKTAARSR